MWYPAKVEVAFGSPRATDPTAIPSAAWTDITTDVARWNTKRGRSYELAEMQTGEGSLSLHNDNLQYSPGYNPVGTANLLPIDIADCGGTLGGNVPSGFYLKSGLTNTTYTVAAKAHANITTPFAHQVTITGGTGSAPSLQTRESGDSTAGPFTLGRCIRVAASTQYTLTFQHYKVSGTATNVQAFLYWLDSNGAVLSTDSSSAFTPGTSVAGITLTATSPAGAKYAAVGIVYATTPSAAQVVQYGTMVLKAGATAPWVDPLNYPNIRPGNPVRITMQDSSLTYKPVFYGFTGEWSEDIDNALVDVSIVDAFELLAEQEIGASVDEVMQEIDPLVRVPFNDAPGANRDEWNVETRTGEVATRAIVGSANAADTSEWAFGEEGPQPGLGSIMLDPESGSVGFSPTAYIPASLPLMNGNDWSAWVWFRIRKLNSREHIFLNMTSPTNLGLGFNLTIDTNGSVNTEWGTAGGASAVIGFPFGVTGNNVADNEWHLVVVTYDWSANRLDAYLDWDGTNGHTDFITGTGMTAVPGDWMVAFGPDPEPPNSYPRANLSEFGCVDRLLSSAEAANIFKVSAPPANYAGEGEAVRIGRLLDFSAWPNTAGSRDLDTSLTTLVSPYPSDTSVLQAIRDTAAAAGGQVFITKSGAVAYRDRRERYNPTTGLTCSVAAATMPENTLSPTIDSDYVYNRVRVENDNGTSFEVNDTESQSKYGIRTLTLDKTLLSDVDTEAAAYWHLYLYRNPEARVPSVTFNASASSNSTLWDFLVGLELMSGSATIALNTAALGTQLFFVESIELTYEQESLTFSGTLELSPAGKFTNVFTLDSGTYGVLDANILGW